MTTPKFFYNFFFLKPELKVKSRQPPPPSLTFLYSTHKLIHTHTHRLLLLSISTCTDTRTDTNFHTDGSNTDIIMNIHSDRWIEFNRPRSTKYHSELPACTHFFRSESSEFVSHILSLTAGFIVKQFQ